MRLRNDEYKLLKCIHWELVSSGKEGLAAQLLNLLTRFEMTREKTREHNRLNAQADREAGYVWPSSKRPKTSKYYPAESEGKELQS